MQHACAVKEQALALLLLVQLFRRKPRFADSPVRIRGFDLSLNRFAFPATRHDSIITVTAAGTSLSLKQRGFTASMQRNLFCAVPVIVLIGLLSSCAKTGVAPDAPHATVVKRDGGIIVGTVTAS